MLHLCVVDDEGHYLPGQSIQVLLNGSLPSNSHMTHRGISIASTASLPSKPVKQYVTGPEYSITL
jgi:hypothetical protein